MRRRSRRRPTAAAMLLLGLAVPATGCDARRRPEPAERPGRDSLAADSADVGATAPDTSETPAAEDGWRPLAVPVGREPDTFPLAVRNPHDLPLIVFADGGAGEVLLDTIPAGDSAHLRLLIAADSVTLRAVGLDGRAGPPELILLTREPEAVWIVRF